jgi:phosphatidylglycerophosphatase A
MNASTDPDDGPGRREPTVRFLVAHPAHLIALGFGSGLPRFAPGTFGTLFGWASYDWLSPFLSPGAQLVWIVFAFVLGCWACFVTGRDLGVADHGGMVWDEIVAMWLVLFIAPVGLLWQALAFGLFRYFDIVKPRPIRRVEQRFKHGRWAGFGVMVDDLIAAFYSLVVIALAVRAVDWVSQLHG